VSWSGVMVEVAMLSSVIVLDGGPLMDVL